MSEINSTLCGREPLPTTAAATPDTSTGLPVADSGSATKGVLDGPSLSVTSNPPSAALADLRQASYDSAMATAKNLVDSPEKRREKEAQRKKDETEKELLAADAARAEAKRELLDEISSRHQSQV